MTREVTSGRTRHADLFAQRTSASTGGEESHSPDGSADGQLALGMTGGRTLSNNKGRPPPMLGLRCGIDALDEACDVSTASCANCFSNLANSSSSCAISRRYTRFCTSTRYCSSLFITINVVKKLDVTSEPTSQGIPRTVHASRYHPPVIRNVFSLTTPPTLSGGSAIRFRNFVTDGPR